MNIKLVSVIKKKIAKKVQKGFGEIQIIKQLKYIRVNSNLINGKIVEAKLKEINKN